MTSPRIALAAPHSPAVAAGQEVLRAGGNVVDVALAAAVALTVTYPHMNSVGGDVIAVIRYADGRRVCVNASGAYGSGGGVEELLREHQTMPVYGPLAVSVPGAPSGWETLRNLAGSLPLATIMAPAIRYAESGMEVSAGLAAALRLDRERLIRDPGIASLFFDEHSEPLLEGTLVRQPALARTLSRLAEHGLDGFYRGALAEDVARGLATLGVAVTLSDLAEHRASVEPALVRRFGSYEVATAGPNSQGFTLLRTVGALHEMLGDDAPAVDAAVLSELFASSDVIRDTVLADPRHAEVDVERYLSLPAFHEAAAAALNRDPNTEPVGVGSGPRPKGDTVAVTAVDSDGTAVSLIQSVFQSFGAQILDPETGMVLHDRAAFFSLDPDSPNVVAAGKRPAHTLVPVVISHDSGAVAAHGTMGGKAQSQFHTQLILRMLQGYSPAEAVSAPRFVVGGLDAGTPNDDAIVAEPELEAEKITQLRDGRLPVKVQPSTDGETGHCMIAAVDEHGELSAGSDPRADGGVLIG